MSYVSDMTADQIKQKIIDLRNDPASIQDFALDMLDSAVNGEIDLSDANSPFFFATELAALQASATMQNDGNLMAGFYPKMSSSQEDLYRWMSDEDHNNRFATPSRFPIVFIMNADEVRTSAVRVDASSQDDIDSVYSKIVIPRNSMFTIAGEVFSMEYPVEIRVIKHGGFVVVYDVSEVTPLLAVD